MMALKHLDDSHVCSIKSTFFFSLSNQADADIEVIKQLRIAGEATATKHKEATSADPTQHSVLLTQYDPGTYMADLDRYIR